MEIDLKNKVIVITGGTKGLGKAIVTQLANSGAKLVINYKSDVANAERFLKEICRVNQNCILVKADVTQEKQVRELYKKALERFEKVDILINNAGSCDDSYIQFMKYDQWDRVIKNNLYTVFLCSRIFSKALIKSGNGKIINIASIKGQVGSEGQCNYSASKAGVIGVTKALAKELGPHNICVNAVCPGFVVTDLNRGNKERIFSFRNREQAWNPKNQRPEMWNEYNTRINQGESIRVFPISNWTEKDIWQYIEREKIDIVPLYFAKERPIVYRDGNIIMVDDNRMPIREGEEIVFKKIRFRTLGCYPLTGGLESNASTLREIIAETLGAVSSERTSRVIDRDGGSASMERRKREGYF